MPYKKDRQGSKRYGSRDFGQKYDLDVSMQTDTHNSDSMRRHERCSYIRYERRCHAGANGQVICRDIPITRYGMQTRTYHIVTTERIFSAGFLLPNSNISVAHFHGQDTDRQEITQHRTRCF